MHALPIRVIQQPFVIPASLMGPTHAAVHQDSMAKIASKILMNAQKVTLPFDSSIK